jgi:hypothetical protein
MILKNRFILDFKLFSEDINAFMKNLHAYFYFGSKLTVVTTRNKVHKNISMMFINN